MNSRIHIRHYTFQGDVINVKLDNNSEVRLNKTKFQFWLLCNGKLRWIISTKEKEIARVEELEGTMSYAEYWMQGFPCVSNDLKEYILSLNFNALKTTNND